MPLHSKVTMEEQAQVFNMAESGWRKVILSTNIAESSITVPDIKYGKRSLLVLLRLMYSGPKLRCMSTFSGGATLLFLFSVSIEVSSKWKEFL